jgi:hypothetical protein
MARRRRPRATAAAHHLLIMVVKLASDFEVKMVEVYIYGMHRITNSGQNTFGNSSLEI